MQYSTGQTANCTCSTVNSGLLTLFSVQYSLIVRTLQCTWQYTCSTVQQYNLAKLPKWCDVTGCLHAVCAVGTLLACLTVWASRESSKGVKNLDSGTNPSAISSYSCEPVAVLRSSSTMQYALQLYFAVAVQPRSCTVLAVAVYFLLLCCATVLAVAVYFLLLCCASARLREVHLREEHKSET